VRLKSVGLTCQTDFLAQLCHFSPEVVFMGYVNKIKHLIIQNYRVARESNLG
jgi:hypothetical protein